MSEHKHKWLKVREMLTIDGRRVVATCDHGCELIGDKIILELNKVAQLETELKLVYATTFTCPRCGHVTESDDMIAKVAQLEAEIKRLRKMLAAYRDVDADTI